MDGVKEGDEKDRCFSQLQMRAEGAGIGGMLSYRALASGDDPWLAEHAGAADLVLVDAPCSGIGAWRRSPDARWLLNADRLAEYRAMQADILPRAAELVKPGGRLVYVTCSLLADENAAQVEAFLESHPAFGILDLAAPVSALGLPPAAVRQGMVTLSPATTATDGFFIAAMGRRDG